MEEVVAVRHGAVRSVVVAGSLVLGVAGAAQAQGGGPVADVAYHGQVVLSRGHLRVWMVPENEGPAALPDVTVRLRLSAELADQQELADGCVRAGMRDVVCGTGPLPMQGQGRHIGLAMDLREWVPEVVVRVDTSWNGGAADRNLSNNEHVVLALDTGDAYVF
ncbi:hypothetical protein ACFV2Q_29715 [Streptomyces sp. NPDC059650]|uniref:hypothetical protein n=1 Tax=Streptomyces sp. NPDC059650 TaxID=3346896 RepID=UPI0036A447C3